MFLTILSHAKPKLSMLSPSHIELNLIISFQASLIVIKGIMDDVNEIRKYIVVY